MQISTSPLQQTKRSNLAISDINRFITAKTKAYLTILRDLVSAWNQRAKQRRALAQLNTYQLKDIGINRSDAINEASKPFWKQ